MGALDDAIRNLIATDVDMVRAIRELTATLNKAAPGAPSGSQAGAASGAQSAGGGATVWNQAQNQKSDTAAGQGVSAVRQLLGGGQPTASDLPSVVSGFVDLALEPGRRAQRIVSGGSAARNAAPLDSAEDREAKGRLGEALTEIDERQKLFQEFYDNGYGDYEQRHANDVPGHFERRQRGFETERRIENRKYEDTRPGRDAYETTRQQLRGFAMGGGMSDEAGKKLADDIYKINLGQAENLLDLERWGRVRDLRMQSGGTGVHSGRGQE